MPLSHKLVAEAKHVEVVRIQQHSRHVGQDAGRFTFLLWVFGHGGLGVLPHAWAAIASI